MINFVIMKQAQMSTDVVCSFKKDEWFNSMPHKGESIVIENKQYTVINVLYIEKSGKWEANVVLMTIEEFERQHNITSKPTPTVSKWSKD